VLASFDDAAGLPCTRNEQTGSIVIVYATNGDATFRCILPPGDGEPPPPSGTPDAFEPNDTSAQAVYLGAWDGDVDRGALCQFSNVADEKLRAVVGATLHNNDDEDWYRARVTEAYHCGPIRMRVVLIQPPGADYSLTITTQPNVVQDVNGPGDITMSAEFSGPDDTFTASIKIVRLSGSVSAQTYELRVYTGG
jgi:hypothetical protein